MFYIINKHNKLVKWILGFIIVTFALWGIGGYLTTLADSGYVAKIGSKKIYLQDIERVVRQNQAQKQNTDKVQILFGLINRQLLLNHVTDNHLVATNDELINEISSIPAFQESNGQFSIKQYKEFLFAQGISAKQFQDDISQQILLNNFLDVFKNSYITNEIFNKQFAILLSRERSVEEYTVNFSKFLDQIHVESTNVVNFYKRNVNKFSTPAKVKVEYIVLSKDDIAKNIYVPVAEINQYIETHKDVFSQQINASHILFAVPQDADKTQKINIRNKSLKVLAELKSHPDLFTKFVHEYSNDTASVKNNGNLGYFPKGVMEKSFEDAAFKLKKGQISELVETKYGYHIIRINDIKQMSKNQMEDVARNYIQTEKAISILQSKIDELNNVTYNNPTTLKPAIDKFHLKLQTSQWITKDESTGEFADYNIQKAIFSDDFILHHNNSAVIDIGNGQYAVYRMLQYQPSMVQSLASVYNQIIYDLKKNQALLMAYQEGARKLFLLKQNKLQLTFNKPQQVNILGGAYGINQNTVKQIFSADLKHGPVYFGNIDQNNNYVIYKVVKESINDKLVSQNKNVIDNFDQNKKMLDLWAYVEYLRNQYKVKYNLQPLMSKDNNNNNNN